MGKRFQNQSVAILERIVTVAITFFTSKDWLISKQTTQINNLRRVKNMVHICLVGRCEPAQNFRIIPKFFCYVIERFAENSLATILSSGISAKQGYNGEVVIILDSVFTPSNISLKLVESR